MSEMSRPCGHHGRAALFKKAWESIQKYIVGANSTRALCQRNRRGVGHLFSNCMALKPLYQSNYAFGGSGGNRNPPDAFASFCIGKRRPPVGCNQEMAAAISSDPNHRYGKRRGTAPVHITAEAAYRPPSPQKKQKTDRIATGFASTRTGGDPSSAIKGRDHWPTADWKASKNSGQAHAPQAATASPETCSCTDRPSRR